MGGSASGSLAWLVGVVGLYVGHYHQVGQRRDDPQTLGALEAVGLDVRWSPVRPARPYFRFFLFFCFCPSCAVGSSDWSCAVLACSSGMGIVPFAAICSTIISNLRK